MDYFNKKTVIPLLILVLLINIFLIERNISEPFIRFNEDNNAVYGLAAQNWLKFGLLNLKLGMVTYWLDNLSQEIRYYTNHPGLFVLPTLFFYKFLGVSEFTTRLSPLIFSLFSIILFFLLIYEVYKDYLLSFLSSFIFATLPALTFYGKMLDHEIFVLFFVLLSFYLFFKIKNTNWTPPNRHPFLIYLFFLTIFIGNFVGWHFYFVPLIIWFLILLDKNYPKRKLFLILTPLILLLSFSLTIYHFYILGGGQALSGLKGAFITRTSALPLAFWLNQIYFLLKLNLTLPILLLGLFWLVYSIFKLFQNKKITLDLALFLFPLLVTLIFRQWVTHPYGPFYYLAFFSLATGKVLYLFGSRLSEISKNEIFPLILITLLLGGQFYSGFIALKFFDQNLILDKESIEFLKEIKNDFNPRPICLGRDQSGLGYGQIFSFYLKTRVLSSPQCLKKAIPSAIIFHPQMGEFYEKEAQLFLENGYQPKKCQGIICLLEKT
jgi:4-amino-4-deoxy-L-arabinose transferase-like glycosyltransferase